VRKLRAESAKTSHAASRRILFVLRPGRARIRPPSSVNRRRSFVSPRPKRLHSAIQQLPLLDARHFQSAIPPTSQRSASRKKFSIRGVNQSMRPAKCPPGRAASCRMRAKSAHRASSYPCLSRFSVSTERKGSHKPTPSPLEARSQRPNALASPIGILSRGGGLRLPEFCR